MHNNQTLFMSSEAKYLIRANKTDPRAYFITGYTLMSAFVKTHDDVMIWRRSPQYWPFWRRIHRSTVDFLHRVTVIRTFDVPIAVRLNMTSYEQAVGQTVELPVIWHAHVMNNGVAVHFHRQLTFSTNLMTRQMIIYDNTKLSHR